MSATTSTAVRCFDCGADGGLENTYDAGDELGVMVELSAGWRAVELERPPVLRVALCPVCVPYRRRGQRRVVKAAAQAEAPPEGTEKPKKKRAKK